MAGNLNRRGGRGGMMTPRDNKHMNMNENKIEFRFLIPSKAASVIIGKGGERIQRLRHECNARLSIPDNQGPERVFILESNMDNCIKIWRECLPELKDCMFSSNNRSSGSFRDDSSDMDLRFLVHDSQVGAIIGKAGVNVKNLRMQFQLNVIKVFPASAPMSSDRVVQMVGKFDKIFECFRVIYDTLEGQSIKGNVEKYNSANFDESLISSYGGWGNPSGGGVDTRKNAQSLGQNDRNMPQNGRFNNRPNEQQQYQQPPFYQQKPDMNRNMNSNLPKPPMNRFDNFGNDNFGNDNFGNDNFGNDNFGNDTFGNDTFGSNAFGNNSFGNDTFGNDSFGNEMEPDNFQMPFNRAPGMGEQNFPGIRKRNNMDMEPENMKRGRMGMGNPNSFDAPRMDRPNFFDNRNEKPNFYDNRNDNKSANRMMESPQAVPLMNVVALEKVDVTIPTSLIHAIKGANGERLSNIITDSGADVVINMVDEQCPDVVLSLTGTKDQIEGAQYLLQICIKKSVLNL